MPPSYQRNGSGSTGSALATCDLDRWRVFEHAREIIAEQGKPTDGNNRCQNNELHVWVSLEQPSPGFEDFAATGNPDRQREDDKAHHHLRNNEQTKQTLGNHGLVATTRGASKVSSWRASQV